MNHMQEILNDEDRALLERVKKILQELQDFFLSLDKPDLVQQVESLSNHLDELFLLVVVGEVKSGKSSFINALFGEKLCKEGVTPITDKIHILRYGETNSTRELEPFIVEHLYPFEPLKNIQIVDTPGTNSLVLEHQKITERFIPKADLVFFITSIDRPFTESERQFLTYIKDLWGKKIVFILSKIDIKEKEEIEEVTEFIRFNCKELMQFQPLIIPVASKLAFQSRQDKTSEMWQKSNFGELEKYIYETLSAKERFKLKVSGPLFTANKMMDKLHTEQDKEKEMIQYDQEVFKEIQKTMEYEQRLIQKTYSHETEKLKNLQQEIQRWAEKFFEQNLTLKHLFHMLRTRKKQIKTLEHELQPIQKKAATAMRNTQQQFYTTAQKLWKQVEGNMQSMLKSNHCDKTFTEKIDDGEYDDLISTTQNMFDENINPEKLLESATKILNRTYTILIVISGAVGFILLICLLVNTLSHSFAANAISLLVAVGTVFAFIKYQPLQKKQAIFFFTHKIKKQIQDVVEGANALYEKQYCQLIEPLKNMIRQRQEQLQSKYQYFQEVQNSIDERKKTLSADNFFET